MRKLLLLLLLFLPLSASAEVYLSTAKPADWADRDLLRVTLLETGRSDAILVECGTEAMLIDGGDASWAAALQHDLEKRGLTEFRYFLNTHPHNDHIEGLLHLMEQGYKPERFMSPFAADWNDGLYHQRAMKLIWEQEIIFRKVRSGDVFSLGNADIHIFRTEACTGMNDRSAIQLITFGDSRILLCADLTGNAQKALLKELTADTLTAQIVKAPHHGENAMTLEFLDAIDPALVLCTAYAGMAPDLVRQTDARKLPMLFSGEGEIVLETDGTDWYVSQHPAQGRGR